mmetsp:Transcript_113979/g.329229  ORF Transcript_113979/g.329229 Transcript_113979/m.329229 type:complete len:1223 (-) Transcript_113979:8-3676(-)
MPAGDETAGDAARMHELPLDRCGLGADRVIREAEELLCSEGDDGEEDDQTSGHVADGCTEDLARPPTASWDLLENSGGSLSQLALRPSPPPRRPSWTAIGSPEGPIPTASLIRVANDDLQEATLRGDLGLARRLVDAGASVNAPMRPEGGSEFMCLLHVLASKPELPGCARIMEAVIEFKANLNVRSSVGVTPLARACMVKNIDAARVLLDAKADPSPVDDFGRNAVRWAVSGQLEGWGKISDAECVQIVKLLTAAGADLDDGGDAPPIVEAVRRSSLQCMLALLQGGAKADGLHDAVTAGPMELISELIQAEANPFARDANGKTVMDLALARGDEELTTALRDYIGNLHCQQHPHLKTFEEQMRLDAAADPTGGDNIGFIARRTVNHNKKASIMDAQELGYRRGLAKGRDRLQIVCRRINKNRYFQGCMFSCLLLALFLPDIWVLGNIVNTDILDAFLLVILTAFVTEFVVQLIGLWKSYTFTFFFWMDMVGVLSVPLDHSLVINALPMSFENAVVMRAARMAKLGARAGRFTKLVKLLRFLPGMKDVQSQGTARVMSAFLNRALSTRVSCLIIIMVVVLPMFELITYPENDFALKMWTDELGDIADVFPDETSEALNEFDTFFAARSYYPYQVRLTYPNGTEGTVSLSRPAPARVQNRVRLVAPAGNAEVMFSFQFPNQIDALCNMLLIITIIALMMGSAMVLSNAVSAIVMVPLEQLLDTVQNVASHIFRSVKSIAGKDAPEEDIDDEEEDATGPMGDETRLLQKLLQRIEVLSEINMKSSPVDADQFALMEESDRALLRGYGGAAVAASFDHVGNDREVADSTIDCELMAQQLLEEAGITPDAYTSWDLNVAELDAFAHHQLCCVILMTHYGSASVWSEQWGSSCSGFVEGAAMLYKKTGSPVETRPPIYHTFVHAVDVAFTTAHILDMCGTQHYLSANERFALAVAAVCHDLGHWGFNNSFLVETCHELAIRYNDTSPLENMHSALLFELARQPRMAIFSELKAAQAKEVRHTCIEAILHTDYQHHFSMVMGMQTLYNMNQELFDDSQRLWADGLVEFPSREVAEFARGSEVKKQLRVMFLHLADLSNPMKPWSMAQPWANLHVEEMLRQGDVERGRGLPVQPLHDRETLNKAYSQISLIEFFTAPLLLAVAQLIPTMGIALDHLLDNAQEWLTLWIEESEASEEEQRRVEDRVMKLRDRCRRVGHRSPKQKQQDDS